MYFRCPITRAMIRICYQNRNQISPINLSYTGTMILNSQWKSRLLTKKATNHPIISGRNCSTKGQLSQVDHYEQGKLQRGSVTKPPGRLVHRDLF